MAGYLGGQQTQWQEDDGVNNHEGNQGQLRSGPDFRDSSMEAAHIGREAPTSQVGYGGRDRATEFAPRSPRDNGSVLDRNDNLGEGKAHGGLFVGGHGTEDSDPRLSESQPMEGSEDLGLPNYGGTPSYGTEQNQRPVNYGTTDGNAYPHEAGYGKSNPGGYPSDGSTQREVSSGAQQESFNGLTDGNEKPSEAGFKTASNVNTGEGGANISGHGPSGYSEGRASGHVPVTQKSVHFQDTASTVQGGLPVPMRPPGAPLLDENHFSGPKREGTASTFESGSLEENEFRGGVPHGIVSGHPSGAGQFGQESNSRGGERPQEYHQTGSIPSHGGSAYSQQYTQPHGPNTPASQLDSTTPATPASTADGHHTSNLSTGETHHEEGLIGKIKSHLPGHKHSEQTGGESKHAAPTTAEAQPEKPSFIHKVKDKLSPSHHKETGYKPVHQ